MFFFFFFVCSVPFFHLQRFFSICSVLLFYLQRSSFLFAAFLFLFAAVRFFVCSVSFLFAAYLFCLQRCFLFAACPLWATVNFRKTCLLHGNMLHCRHGDYNLLAFKACGVCRLRARRARNTPRRFNSGGRHACRAVVL